MRSPPQIAIEPLPQAHRGAMRIEQLIDHERQLFTVRACESSAAFSSNDLVPAHYQHDFNSN